MKFNPVTFKNCIKRIYRAEKDDVEDFNFFAPMFNLLECSSNYSETTDSEQVYSKDEATNFNADFENTNAFKSLK